LPPVDQSMAGHDSVAGHDLIGHPEVAAAVGDELVDFFEGSGIEQEIDPFAGGQLAGGVLLPAARLAAAELGAAFEIGKRVFRVHRGGKVGPYALTVSCAFSQSFRNFSNPRFVSG